MYPERGDQSLLHVITSIEQTATLCRSLRGTWLVSEQTLSAVALAADSADDRPQQCGKIGRLLLITDMFTPEVEAMLVCCLGPTAYNFFRHTSWQDVIF